MKRIVPIFLLMAALGLSPVTVRAEVSSANLKAMETAFQALDVLVRETRAQGSLPRLSDPAHAKVLDRLWDVKATLGRQPYRAADIRALLTIADRANAVFKTYILFTPQADAVPDLAANTFEYQDELSRSGAYVLHVFAAQLEAITDFAMAMPTAQMNEVHRAGVRQLRLGINQQVTGLALMLRSKGLKSENRLILLDALDHAAVLLASVSPVADRAAMVAQIDAILPDLSASERDKAQSIRSAFTSRECGRLCAIGE